MSDEFIITIFVLLILAVGIMALRYRRSLVAAAAVKVNEAKQGMDLADGSIDGGGDGD